MVCFLHTAWKEMGKSVRNKSLLFFCLFLLWQSHNLLCCFPRTPAFLLSYGRVTKRSDLGRPIARSWNFRWWWSLGSLPTETILRFYGSMIRSRITLIPQISPPSHGPQVRLTGPEEHLCSWLQPPLHMSHLVIRLPAVPSVTKIPVFHSDTNSSGCSYHNQSLD